ncbi:hypothetical protein WMO13_07870 [Ignatzschineria larvae DSM 13226]|uniref:Uncharacterized protein n=1 Tax=Ignatzschineria larvae DSM 13226 TaxID=1111732 RepID=A0ABZ3C2P5_9GAMM|nr:hypothetical protein [Ignatzschineria larvae]
MTSQFNLSCMYIDSREEIISLIGIENCQTCRRGIVARTRSFVPTMGLTFLFILIKG